MLHPAAVAAMTRALAEVLGPIAPRLISRAAAEVGTQKDLEAACLAMVDVPKEREHLRRLFAALPPMP